MATGLTTLKQVRDHFVDIASRHQQINSFGYGDIWDVATSGTINYPLMFVSPEGSVAKRGEVGYKYKLFVMDLVQKRKDNEVDASSDTHQMLIDVLTELFKGGQQATGSDYLFELKLDNIAITDFTEKFDDEVAGNLCDITLWVEWTADKCAAVFSGVAQVAILSEREDQLLIE